MKRIIFFLVIVLMLFNHIEAKTKESMNMEFKLSSKAFKNGELIPDLYSNTRLGVCARIRNGISREKGNVY